MLESPFGAINLSDTGDLALEAPSAAAADRLGYLFRRGHIVEGSPHGGAFILYRC